MNFSMLLGWICSFSASTKAFITREVKNMSKHQIGSIRFVRKYNFFERFKVYGTSPHYPNATSLQRAWQKAVASQLQSRVPYIHMECLRISREHLLIHRERNIALIVKLESHPRGIDECVNCRLRESRLECRVGATNRRAARVQAIRSA